MIESLETRLMNAVTSYYRPFYTLSRGTLKIEGSLFNDVITVHMKQDRVRLTLNGHHVTLHERVRRATIFGGDGDDRIDFGAENGIEDLNDIGASAFIDGGRGSDTIQSGPHDDTLFGGNGNDVLNNAFDSSSGEYMDGGRDDDVLRYGNTMYGGSGKDSAVLDDFSADPLTASIESFDYVGEGQIFFGPGPYLDNLSTRNGKLLFKYTSRTGYNTRLVGPTLREDGMLQITVRNGLFISTNSPPSHELTLTLDYQEANRRGVVVRGRNDREQLLVVPSVGR